MTSRIISYWAPGSRDVTPEDWKQCQDNLHYWAIEKGGVNESDGWNLERIRGTRFYQDNLKTLQQPRGGGYWLWKPYIILQTLKSMSRGDYVIYHDVGKPEHDKTRKNRFFMDISPVLEFTRNNGGICPGPYIPVNGPNKAWIKRDCFLLMGCDSVEYWRHCQIQATYNVWQVSNQTIEFVEEWLEYCTDARILTDQPNELGVENWPAFIGHRHDKAVLTLLCLKKGVRSLGSPKQTIVRHRNLTFFTKAYISSLDGNIPYSRTAGFLLRLPIRYAYPGK